MQQYKKFALDVSWTLLSSVITIVVGFLLRIVLARWLGANDLGVYQMTLTIYGVFVLIATFGIPAALVKFVAEYKENDKKLHQITSCGFINAILLGIIIGTIIFFISPTLANVFDMPELKVMLKILSVIFPFASVYQTQTGILNGLRKMNCYAMLIICQSVSMCIFIVTFILLGYGIGGAISGLVLSVVGTCLLGIIITRDFLGIDLKGYIQNTKRVLSFGGQMFMANAVNLITNQADFLLIGYFLTATDIGYYSVAVSIASFITLIPLSIQKITYPATSEYWANGDTFTLSRMIDKAMRYSTCVLLIFGLGIGFFSKEIITILFGRDFIYATLPLCVLLIARVIRGGVVVSIGSSLAAVGRPDLNLKIGSISAVTNVILNILFIPSFGILGAAIATTMSLLLGASIFIGFAIRLLPMKIDINLYLKVAGITLAAVALFFVYKYMVTTYLLGVSILFVYIILIIKIFLTKEDRNIFKSVIRLLLYK